MDIQEIMKILRELYNPMAQRLKKECNIENFDEACQHVFRHLGLHARDHVMEDLTLEKIEDAWERTKTDLGLD